MRILLILVMLISGCAPRTLVVKDSQPVVVILRDINFDPNSAALTPLAEAMLNEYESVFVKYDNIKVRIEGYTAVNEQQDLSEQRVAAVVNYIVSGGVNKDRITSTIYKGIFVEPGITDSPEARLNRRIVVKADIQP